LSVLQDQDQNQLSIIPQTKENYNGTEKIPGADPGWGGGAGSRPPKIEKKMIFWRKIVIFHTKYPKNFRASLRSAHFF
jgi:hypothetical protein